MYWQESRIDGDPAPDDTARNAVRREFCAGRRRTEIVGKDYGPLYFGSGGSEFGV
jgi:hypothetical protein